MTTENKLFKPSSINCDKHKEEKLSHWCEKCSVSCCKECILSHPQHSLKDIDIIYSKIPSKDSLLAQQKDMKDFKVLLEEQYGDFESLSIPYLKDIKTDQKTLLKNQIQELEDLLGQVRKVYQKSLENEEVLDDLDIVEFHKKHKKFRLDENIKQIKDEIQSFRGFTIGVEPYLDEEFLKIYSEAYCNRSKDHAMTNILADKLLRKYPLNLCALTLKAEAREGHDLFKFILTQPIYDEFDEFAHAEASLLLKQKEEAFRLYESSCKKGCVFSEHKLGTIYFNGDPELKIQVNKKLAIQYFTRASEKGLALSQYNLGYCYYLGDGLPKDKVMAFKYYKLAADQGYATAEHKLGHCYENAIGTEQNFDEAKKYYTRAAQKNHDAAMGALDLLMSKIEHEKEEKEKEEKQKITITPTVPKKKGFFGF